MTRSPTFVFASFGCHGSQCQEHLHLKLAPRPILEGFEGSAPLRVPLGVHFWVSSQGLCKDCLRASFLSVRLRVPSRGSCHVSGLEL